MKKIHLIGLLLLLFVINAEAQQVYSVENLEKSSLEDLQLYLGKAQRLKKTGAILSIAGPATALTGLLLSGQESTFPLGFGMLLAGTGVTLIGLPVLATGSSRIKRVNASIDKKQSSARFNLEPVFFYTSDMHIL
ncbi:MAG: hypothetical protein P8100_15515 [bacterium]